MSTASPQPPLAPALTIACDPAINYAFQQNAIPVVKELRYFNDATPRKDLTLRLSTDPAFAEPWELRLQAIEAGGEHRVAPLDLKLNHDFLAELPEKISGWLKLEVADEAAVLCSKTMPIALLARNEWCGLVSLPEILAAFSLPNDPAVMSVLGRAAELLREHAGRTGFNGYQDKNRKRAWEQVAAIYKAIAELGIRYISPPASFETTGQKILFPSDILHQRFGTCLDLALLFSACCEQVGLHPLILMHEGHAYAGCWLEERTHPESCDDNLQQLRKLAADSLVTVFETTLVTSEKPGNAARRRVAGRSPPANRVALPPDARRQARAPLANSPAPHSGPARDAGHAGKHAPNRRDRPRRPRVCRSALPHA